MTVQSGNGAGEGNGAEASGGGAGAEGSSGTGAGSQSAEAGGGQSSGEAAAAAASGGRSGEAAEAAGAGKSGNSLSQAEFDAMKARVSQLEGELNDAVTRRKTAAEERDSYKSKYEQEVSGRQQAERKVRHGQAVAEVVRGVPLAHRQAATDALFRLHAEGTVDLAAEDRTATVESAQKKLKESYPQYFEEPTQAPRMPGVGTGTVPTAKLGVVNGSGERLL